VEARRAFSSASSMACNAAYTVCSSTRPRCRPPPVAVCGHLRPTASSSRDARQEAWAVLPCFRGSSASERTTTPGGGPTRGRRPGPSPAESSQVLGR
jgi:hypothetical protein